MQPPHVSVKWLANIVILCGCMAIGLLGCGKGSNKITADSQAAMASADPAIKVKWDSAMSAAKSNEYAGAIIILKSMVDDPKLTPEQKTAVENSMKAVSDEMYDALNRGDAKAQQAIEQLRTMSGR